MPMSQTPFIEALRSQLGQINLDGVTRPEGTQLLSKCVRKMSSGMGFRCFPEYPAVLIQGRNSYIDFVCSERGGFGATSNIAIEIDSSNKALSLQKLLEMHDRGFHCVWVRWCVPICIIVPEKIHVIDLF